MRAGPLAVFVLLILIAAPVVASTWVEPQLGAGASLLMDTRTGRILYARQSHRRMAPASTTKIATALVVIERLSPDAVVTVGRTAATVRRGAWIGLRAGERWTVSDLLHAMMLRSANDAAVALAEAVAGSVPRFAALMNARARRAGARSTQFVNPHGWDDPHHYTTAYDLALIARDALRHPRFAALVRARTWVWEGPGRPRDALPNRNAFLERYPGADGVKTGQTAAAGHTFVGSATRDGWQLLTVLLRSDDVYGDAATLLDYGFAAFRPVRVATRGQRLATAAIGPRRREVVAVPSEDVYAVVRRGAQSSQRVIWRPGLRLPVEAGSRVAEVRVFEGSTLVARAPLVAARSVAP